MTTPRAPKYRTTTQACSCLGYWYRRTCKHYRAYRDAVALLVAQDAVNVTWDTARGASGAVRGSQKGRGSGATDCRGTGTVEGTRKGALK